jgi:hypothetical protein
MYEFLLKNQIIKVFFKMIKIINNYDNFIIFIQKTKNYN